MPEGTLLRPGVVETFRRENPHSSITLRADTQVWTLELPSPAGLERFGVTVEAFAPGSAVTVKGSPHKTATLSMRPEWLVRDDGLRDGTGRWTINQGLEIGRPSRIFIEADVSGGKITAVRCGGTAVMMTEGTIRRPI